MKATLRETLSQATIPSIRLVSPKALHRLPTTPSLSSERMLTCSLVSLLSVVH